MYTILIVGVYPGFNTGYGKQTRFIVNYLIENGNKVIMYRSSPEPKDNIYLDDKFKKLYIKDFQYDRYDNFGFQQINKLTEKLNIDLIYALMDLCWVSDEPEITKCPKILHVPIDHTPLYNDEIKKLSYFDHVFTMSDFGKKQLDKLGFYNTRIYHTLDLDIPLYDKSVARKELNIPENYFTALLIGSNSQYPCRKHFDLQIQAFVEFKKLVPKSVLIINTDLIPKFTGININMIIDYYDLHDNVLQTPKNMDEQTLYKLYNASDVLLHATGGEGFGVCIIEAQYNLCPVITTRFSSMPELTVNGISTEKACDQLLYDTQPWINQKWTNSGFFRTVPSIENVKNALLNIYHRNPKITKYLGEMGRNYVQKYFNPDLICKKVETEITKVIQRKKNNKMIPNVLYMTCKDKKELPEYVEKNWKFLNPDLKIKIYDDKDCIKFLVKKFSQEHAKIFTKLEHGPYKADFWRLCVLYHYGGYYSDIDMYPLKSLKYIIPENVTFATCLSIGQLEMFQSFIASTKKNPILKKCIDTTLELYRKKISPSKGGLLLTETTDSKNYWKGTSNMFQQLIKYKGMKRILLKRYYGDKYYSLDFIRSEMLRTKISKTNLEEKFEKELEININSLNNDHSKDNYIFTEEKQTILILKEKMIKYNPPNIYQSSYVFDHNGYAVFKSRYPEYNPYKHSY